jgi:hypothetical protein
LKRRAETDAAWREHLVSISRARRRRDKIAA